MKTYLLPLFAALLLFHPDAPARTAAAEAPRGTVVTETLASVVLRENRTGLDPNRVIKVYLPPGYATSGRSYPVVYFCHNLNWSAEQVFENGNMAKQLERAFARGVVGEFILVAASYTTPTMGSFYENSSTTGRWLDYTADEVVPFIDGKFRTLRHRDSRALVGDFMGGRGVLQLAMTHAGLFSVAYAMHPVATGAGYLPINYLDVDWRKIHQAKAYDELSPGGRTRIFLMICQAFLPNPSRPPFYCDLPMEIGNDVSRIHPDNNRALQKGFHLDETLDEHAANLRTLRGLAFDWGRYDSTTAHVLANQAFTRKLADLGIPHEAEEFSGSPWDQYWGEDGRFPTRVLPFLARHLVYQK
ncbi:MAG TPA: alpha/beta hydrolase-fold protein [Lacunisphaera sp.]|nr:alpha/beta hydrolase-fold protein [Lacunisphaera sp.]